MKITRWPHLSITYCTQSELLKRSKRHVAVISEVPIIALIVLWQPEFLMDKTLDHNRTYLSRHLVSMITQLQKWSTIFKPDWEKHTRIIPLCYDKTVRDLFWYIIVSGSYFSDPAVIMMMGAGSRIATEENYNTSICTRQTAIPQAR